MLGDVEHSDVGYGSPNEPGMFECFQYIEFYLKDQSDLACPTAEAIKLFEPCRASNCSAFLRTSNMTKIIRYPYPTEASDAQSTTDHSEVKPIPKSECPIGMEHLEATKPVKPFGHTFHLACIQSWVLTQTGNLKNCSWCRTRMKTLQQLDSLDCCVSAQSVLGIRSALPAAQERSEMSPSSPSAPPTQQPRRSQLEEELEIFEIARRAAGEAQLELFERFEQDRREADRRAEELRLKWQRLWPPPITLFCIFNVEANKEFAALKRYDLP
jgi:hypothetical protein